MARHDSAEVESDDVASTSTTAVNRAVNEEPSRITPAATGMNPPLARFLQQTEKKKNTSKCESKVGHEP